MSRPHLVHVGTTRPAGFKPGLESLEDRAVPSSMVWANRGQESDRFVAVFGANAEAARKVVDYSLASWGKVIVNLNQPAIDASPDKNTITFTVRMSTDKGNGGSASANTYAYPTDADKEGGRNGYPTTGTISLDAGVDGQPDKGWWIDPNPGDLTPFTNVLSPFAANRGRNAVGVDMVDIINGEIAHVLGLFSGQARLQTPLAGTLTKVAPAVEDRHSDGKAGFYYVFDGPSVTQLLTSYDSGAGDTGAAIHTPQPRDTNLPVPFASKFRGAVTLTGALDAGNAVGGSRVIPSDNLMLLFRDAYGYDVLLPSTQPGGTFNASVTPARRLVIKGGPDGDATPTGDVSTGGAAAPGGDGHGAGHGLGPQYLDNGPASPDRITLKRDGDFVVVTIEPGRGGPLPNTDRNAVGAARPIVTRVPLASFTSIELDAEGGDDTVVLDLSGGNFLPAGGFDLSGGDGADKVMVVGGGAFKTDGRTLTFPGMGTVQLGSVARLDEATGLSANTTQGAAVVIEPAAVKLAAGSPLGFATVTRPARGKVVVNPNGTLSYTPDRGFRGDDTFNVTLSDGTTDGSGDAVTFPVSVRVNASPGLVGVPTTAVGGTDGTFRVVTAGKAGAAVTPFLSFTGSVRVASADLNGDGVPDTVAGTGPGSATHLRVLDGKTGAELFAVDPFEASFTGGVFVAAGDVNGDGTPDLIVSPDGGGGPRVRVFSGKGFGQLADFFGIDDPAFRGGARAATGDLNGDGVADLVVSAGTGGGPRVAVVDGKSNFARKLVADFFAFENSLRNGLFPAVGDVDGDGLSDLVAGAGPGGGPRVVAFSGRDLLAAPAVQTRLADYFAGDPNRRDGVRVAVKDLDGDAKADVVAAVGATVLAYSGKGLKPGAVTADLSPDLLPGQSGGVFVG